MSDLLVDNLEGADLNKAVAKEVFGLSDQQIERRILYYTSSIDHAWRIVTHLKDNGWEFHMTWEDWGDLEDKPDAYRWSVSFYLFPKDKDYVAIGSEFGDSPTVVICKAALKAVRDNRDKQEEAT